MVRTASIILAGVLLPAVSAWGEGTTSSGPQLPAGSGREIAAAHCVSCHDGSRLVTPGYNRAGWEDVIERMTKLGVVLSADERPVLTDYLVQNFPPQPQAAPKVVAGTTSVSFHEWAVATPGAFPHDPLATADGAIWYTGQRASLLGRIDPQSGAIREYPTGSLPMRRDTSGSLPTPRRISVGSILRAARSPRTACRILRHAIRTRRS